MWRVLYWVTTVLYETSKLNKACHEISGVKSLSDFYQQPHVHWVLTHSKGVNIMDSKHSYFIFPTLNSASDMALYLYPIF